MGTGSAAADAANNANAQRQNQINQTVAQINSAYGSPARQQQYNTYGTNLTNYYTNQVNQQQQVNARDLKFAMARSGLTGGSAASDANVQLGKDYTNGLLQASQQGQAGKAALQTADLNSKNQLVSLAEQGDYTGAIPSQIAASQSAALGAAQNFGQANSLGNLFSNTAGIYQNEQTAAANRRAAASPIGSIYGSASSSPSPFGA